jgi:hypothetical protein
MHGVLLSNQSIDPQELYRYYPRCEEEPDKTFWNQPGELPATAGRTFVP